MLPAAVLGLADTPRARVRSLILSALVGVALFLGSVLATFPAVAVPAMFALSVGAALLAARSPMGNVLLALGLPVLAIGLSYDDPGDSLFLAALIVLGSVYAFLVSLAWPTITTAAPVAVPEQPPGTGFMLRYGIRLGLAVSIAAAVGFALDLEHVGWAAGAAALVMRPDPHLLRARGVDRVLSVTLGAVVACLVVRADLAAGLLAFAVVADLTALAATHRSRWYVTGAFTTFVVFLMLLLGAPDQAGHRFWERVGETVLGVGLAGVFGVVVPSVRRRRRPRAAAAL